MRMARYASTNKDRQFLQMPHSSIRKYPEHCHGVSLHTLHKSTRKPSYFVSPDIGHLYPQAMWNSPQQHWMSAISKTGTTFRFLGSSYANSSCLTPQSLLMRVIVPIYDYFTVLCFISSYKLPLIQQGKKSPNHIWGSFF